MSASEVRRIKELEAKSARLKKMYAGQAPRERCDQGRSVAKIATPIARRAAVQILLEERHLSRVRACRAVGLSRLALYKPTKDWSAQDAPIIHAINAVLEKRPR